MHILFTNSALSHSAFTSGVARGKDWEKEEIMNQGIRHLAFRVHTSSTVFSSIGTSPEGENVFVKMKQNLGGAGAAF